jgi:hypothetical protein
MAGKNFVGDGLLREIRRVIKWFRSNIWNEESGDFTLTPKDSVNIQFVKPTGTSVTDAGISFYPAVVKFWNSATRTWNDSGVVWLRHPANLNLNTDTIYAARQVGDITVTGQVPPQRPEFVVLTSFAECSWAEPPEGTTCVTGCSHEFIEYQCVDSVLQSRTTTIYFPGATRVCQGDWADV